MGRITMRAARLVALLAFVVLPFAALAADYPAPKDGEWVARDFKFHTGETLAELKLHYTTVGDPSGIQIIVLPGTAQSAASVLTPAFAGELFGPGQPLDASKYFIVIPDAIGHGKSSKPSDGLSAQFPHYGYRDVVVAFHRMLVESLGVDHARLIFGQSMGGMQTWLMGEMY